MIFWYVWWVAPMETQAEFLLLFRPYFIKQNISQYEQFFGAHSFPFSFFLIRHTKQWNTHIWCVLAHIWTYRFEFLNEYFKIVFLLQHSIYICMNIWMREEKKINLMNEIFAWHDIKHICNIYLNIWTLPNGYCYCYCYFVSLIFEYRLS